MASFWQGILSILERYGPSLLLGVRTTLIVSLTGTILGLILGLAVGGLRAARLDYTASPAARILKKLFDILGRNRNDRERIVPENPEKLFSIRTARTAEGWETRYRIPAAFLRKYFPGFAFSGILKANVYKCGDKTVHPHYLAWNPVASAVPDYHRPECFGEMVFG